jgi:putative ATP-binding cassette transporter
MRLLLFLTRSSRALFVSALSTSAFGGLAAAALVALMNHAIEAEAVRLPALAASFTGLAVVAFGLRALAQCQFAELSQSVLATLRLHVSEHLARSPYRDIERHGPARLLATLTEDVVAVSEFFATLPRLAMYAAVLFGCAAYLIVLAPAAAGIVAVAVAVAVALERWLGNTTQEHLLRARAAEDVVIGHFRALFYGAKELKLNGARRRMFLANELAHGVTQASEERASGLTRYAAAGARRVLVFYLVIGGVIFGLAPVLGLGPEVSSGYALMYLYMMLPLQSLIDAVPATERARIALRRMEAIGVRGEPHDDISLPAPCFDPLACLRLEDVTHSYRRDDEDGTFTLGPVSLELRPGELVYLIGGNGSGKTTLAKVIAGLYTPQTGRVLWNGASVDDARREAYRQQFSAIFSDFHLFESLLGIDHYQRDDRARALLSTLGLAHKVQIEDGRLSTTQLSAGQRKRLALLVALLEERPIHIFDEWAADQDAVYRERFYTEILPELKRRGKAVLVITHDDRFFHLADRCLVLDAGQLRRATPEALIERSSPSTPAPARSELARRADDTSIEAP